MKRIIGIDYGKARIGVALAYESQNLALPHKTIQASPSLSMTLTTVLKELKEVLKEAKSVIIGLPILLNGKDSKMTEEVRLFAEELKKLISIPIFLWDERLTTAFIKKSLIETKVKRKKRDKISDPLAATLILQNYLDSSNNNLQV
jgi:putative Holliday junction resolvase